MSNTSNPYEFTVKGVTFDFYDFSDAVGFSQSAVEHAVKKLVALGGRSGNKSYGQDLHEAIMSLLRAQEQHNESLRSAAGGTSIQLTLPIIAPLFTPTGTGESCQYRAAKEQDYYRCLRGGSPDDGVEEALRALEAWARTYESGKL
jgi:hypothetical protein